MRVQKEEKKQDETYNGSKGAAPEEAEGSFSDYLSELLRLVGEMASQHADMSVKVLDLSGHSSEDDEVFDLLNEGFVVIANPRFTAGKAWITNGARGAMARFRAVSSGVPPAPSHGRLG